LKFSLAFLFDLGLPDAFFKQQLADGIAGLSPGFQITHHPLLVDADISRIAQGVVVAEVGKSPTITGFPGVDRDDPVERPMLGTEDFQSEGNGHGKYSFFIVDRPELFLRAL